MAIISIKTIETFKIMKHKISILFISFIFAFSSMRAAPLWEKEVISNGHLRIDGELNFSIPLGQLIGGSPEFAFPITLTHEFSKYPCGEYQFFSQWQVPQLVSYAMPHHSDVIWVGPGGEEIHFKEKTPDAPVYKVKPGRQTAQWAAVRGDQKSEPDRIYITGKDGWSYIYDKGILKYLQAPSGRRLFFKTDNINITAIEQEIDGKTVRLLSAEYDDIGRLKTLEIGPVSYTFEYDGDTEILLSAKRFGSNDESIKFKYENGVFSSVSFPDGKRKNFSWIFNTKDWESPNGLFLDYTTVKRMLLSDGEYVYDYGYDKDGTSLIRTNLLGQKEKVTVNFQENKVTRVDRGGVSRTIAWGKGREHEALNQLSEVTSADGTPLIKLKYDPEGRISEMLERGKAPVQYQYDKQDRVSQITRGDYPAMRYSYKDDMKKPSRITMPTGAFSEYTYDANGQLTSSKNEAGITTRYTYDNAGRIVRTNIASKIWSAYSYDSFGRISEIKHSNGNSVKYTYNERNRLASALENGERLWEYEYHPNGQLKRILKNSELWTAIEREISGETEHVMITDAKGGQHRKTFDIDGNLLRDINPLGEKTEFKYDPIGQLTGWEDPNKNKVGFKYDEAGRIVFQENEEAQLIRRSYDEFGKMIEKTTDEQNIKIEYDKFERPVMRDFGDGQILKYEYDMYGRLCTLESGGIVTDLRYDAMDRLTGRRVKYPDGNTVMTLISYTNSGRRKNISTTMLNGDKKSISTVEYVYDDLDRPKEIIFNSQPQIRYEYDSKTQMLSLKSLSNGEKTNFSYDSFGRLSQMENTDPQKKSSRRIVYKWGDDGNLIGRSISEDSI